MWIAVLPFQHPAADSEIESFADGLAQDITAALSQFSYLSVIARDSTQRVKDPTQDVRAAREQLGARFIRAPLLVHDIFKLRMTGDDRRLRGLRG
jgi:TolB-like protein